MKTAPESDVVQSTPANRSPDPDNRLPTSPWCSASTLTPSAAASRRIGHVVDVRWIEAAINGGSSEIEANELTGANYSTSGHLMVVVGFTKSGDVVVNDPASRSDPAVRNVYLRHQFETVWLRTERPLPSGGTGGGSGGVAYIITPHGMPLPPA